MIKNLIKKCAHIAGGLLGINYVQQQLVATQTALAQTQATLEQAQAVLTKLLVNQVTIGDIYKAQSVAALHQKTFGAYKNAYQGKEVVLVATGPTLKDYTPIAGAVHVGVNKAFTYDKFDLDVMFAQDYYHTQSYLEDFCTYTNPKNPKKFLGIGSDASPKTRIPESIALKHDVNRYYYMSAPYELESPTYDIANQILWDGYSVVFSAIQLILYTNPAKIYLVGCDCNSSGYFNGSTSNAYDDPTVANLIVRWNQIKTFAQQHYPETEIISINPVGLKGLFKDIG